MITPAFELSQEPDFLCLKICVPYTRTSEFDLYIDGEDLKFFAKPYFLRLTLPGKIVEDGRETASFDLDTGVFTLRVPKQTAGQHFEGLQMLTSLLAPKGARSARQLVEDLEPCSGGAGEEQEEEEEDFDWQVEQEAYAETPEGELQTLQKYGFGNLRTGVFSRLQEELREVVDVRSPDSSTGAERRRSRLDAETTSFSPDHYLADLHEDEDVIKNLQKFKPWWAELRPDTTHSSESDVVFTEEQKEQMRRFSNRSFLLEKPARGQAWLGLVDLVLAYAYEVRTTEGEFNVESAWTLRKLSGTLCWLETFCSLQEVLVCFGRRVLCYPLFRHFALVTMAIRDTARIFRSGKACILKCLLDVHRIFRENDPAYILNDLYITDYCVWIQKVKSKRLCALAAALGEARVRKEELGLDLELLEQAALLTLQEERRDAPRGGEAPGNETPTGSGEEDSDDLEEEEGDSSEEEEDSDSSEEEESDSSEKEEEKNLPSGNTGGGGEKGEEDGTQTRAASAPDASLPGEAPGTEENRHGRLLIQELGQRLGEGLRITGDASGGGPSYGGGRERENDREGEGEGAGATERRRGTLLEVSPHRHPLCFIRTPELDSGQD